MRGIFYISFRTSQIHQGVNLPKLLSAGMVSYRAGRCGLFEAELPAKHIRVRPEVRHEINNFSPTYTRSVPLVRKEMGKPKNKNAGHFAVAGIIRWRNIRGLSILAFITAFHIKEKRRSTYIRFFYYFLFYWNRRYSNTRLPFL